LKFRFNRISYYIGSFFKLLLSIKTSSIFLVVIRLFSKSSLKTIYIKKFDLTFRFKKYLDLLILKEVILDEEYEYGKVKINNQDKVIIDIGAGFGDFSILTAKRFPEAKVFAFEPNSSYFSLLQENINQNRVKNVMAFKKAVTSLDEVFSLVKSGKIDFLKMDCEGCEYEIINKRKSYSLQKVKKLVMEYHENQKKSASLLKEALEKANFTVLVKPRKEVPGIGLLYALNKS